MANEAEWKLRLKGIDDTEDAWKSAEKGAKDFSSLLDKLFKKKSLSPKDLLDSKHAGFKPFSSDQSRRELDKSRGFRQEVGSTAEAALLSDRKDMAIAEKVKGWAQGDESKKIKNSKEFEKESKKTSESFKKINKDSKDILKNLKLSANEMKNLSQEDNKPFEQFGGKGGQQDIGTMLKGTTGGQGTDIGSLMKMFGGKGGGGGFLGGMGGAAGGAIGSAIAAAAGAYLLMAKMGNAYSGAAGSQMSALRTMGVGAEGAQSPFFQGVPGLEPEGMRRWGVGPNQYTQMLGEISKQTMGFTGASRPIDIARTAAQTASVYGLDTGTVGNLAGSLERYGTKGTGESNLFGAIGRAEVSGMGGARMGEFFGNLQDAIQTAVGSGMTISNEDMIRSLGRISNVSDERLKALAPQIMQTQMGRQNTAAMMEGGAAESLMFQSTWERLRKDRGRDVSFMEVQEELASAGPDQVLKDTVGALRNLTGNDAMATFMAQRMKLFGDVASPSQTKKLMDNISSKEQPYETDENVKKIGQTALETRGQELSLANQITIGKEISSELVSLTDVAKNLSAGTTRIDSTLKDILRALLSRKGGDVVFDPTDSSVRRQQ